MNAPHQLYLLSGGAAQGLVRQLLDSFQTSYSCRINATFDAVIRRMTTLYFNCA